MHPEQHSYVRQYAAAALLRLPPSPASIAALEGCVSSQTERHFVRIECALTLAGWGNSASAPIVIAALGSTTDQELRYWLASSLVTFDTAEGWATIEQLRDDHDLFLYASARDWTQRHLGQPAVQPAETGGEP
jgi:HEAT repeat protein